VYNGTRLPPILPSTSSTFTTERHLLWDHISNDTASTRIRGPASHDIGNRSQHNLSSPPPHIAPPPPLPPLPCPAPVFHMKADDAPPGAHKLCTASRDGESDMELSDSDI
jgi:hypothetical protein